LKKNSEKSDQNLIQVGKLFKILAQEGYETNDKEKEIIQ